MIFKVRFSYFGLQLRVSASLLPGVGGTWLLGGIPTRRQGSLPGSGHRQRRTRFLLTDPTDLSAGTPRRTHGAAADKPVSGRLARRGECRLAAEEDESQRQRYCQDQGNEPLHEEKIGAGTAGACAGRHFAGRGRGSVHRLSDAKVAGRGVRDSLRAERVDVDAVGRLGKGGREVADQDRPHLRRRFGHPVHRHHP